MSRDNSLGDLGSDTNKRVHGNMGGIDRGELKCMTIRLYESDINRLELYYSMQDIPVRTGIRHLIIQGMKDNNI